MVRYKWWYKLGYMSSTGKCFDIGTSTELSLKEFESRQNEFAHKYGMTFEQMDCLSDSQLVNNFNIYCSEDGLSGCGALMRLVPVPLFFFRHPTTAIELPGRSEQITNRDQKVYDVCRYYGALVVAALHGEDKSQLLDADFYSKHSNWFGDKSLHSEIQQIARGSYKKLRGYAEGIRGNGYIVNALEAALWAF